MLTFESSLSNTVNEGDDDEGDLSWFLLGLATSRAALGGSWVLDFPYLPPLVAFYDMQEKTAVQFYSLRNCRELDCSLFRTTFIWPFS